MNKTIPAIGFIKFKSMQKAYHAHSVGTASFWIGQSASGVIACVRSCLGLIWQVVNGYL